MDFDELIPEPPARVNQNNMAVVSSISPLRIRMWGDNQSLLGTPETLVHPDYLSVNSRVFVEFMGGRPVIMGLLGGTPKPKVEQLGLDDLITNSDWTVTIVGDSNFVRVGNEYSVELNITRTGAAIATTATGNSANSTICQLKHEEMKPVCAVALTTTSSGNLMYGWINTAGSIGYAGTVPGYGVTVGQGFTIAAKWTGKGV